MTPDKLLLHVWSHMHGTNMDGTRRYFLDDDACMRNWKQLQDAIGAYLHEQDMMAVEASKPETLRRIREILE